MSTTRPPRRAGWRTWLVVALLVVPVLELAVVIQVGQWIGAWPTVLLLVAESALGAWLLGREGPGAWRRLRAALGAGHVPTDELIDAALILIGGTLLLTPGFLTDAVGFVCVIPPTRPLVRGTVRRAIGRRAGLGPFFGPGPTRRPGRPDPRRSDPRRPGPGRQGPDRQGPGRAEPPRPGPGRPDVVQGEVVRDDDRDRRPDDGPADRPQP